MLSFLNRRGPLTEGIFSKSANIKSCRILKDKLNSGVKVNPYNESVHVVASVLKDFLRNIPGSVLLTDLYNKWLGVIDQGNEEEKITAAQRLLAQLPRANVVLLRYLFGVLYNIEQHSSSNQMTAYNLSACIAPSLLCPPKSGSLELEDNLIKKISLVAFLIENCLRIFGEDITSLLGENSMSHDPGKKTVKSRSFGDRAFGRACSTCQDNQGTAPPSAKPGQLFGVSLTDVCDKDNLAFPILGMLSFLNRRGPLTEGIFSKSANIKSCRILKDKLNSGVKVNPYNESVHVVASVLKDFLRNIPGSVLLTDLYDKWLGVIDQGNEEEKITAAQRLLAQLPRANVVLLRFFFGVLYNIEQHSSSNQMTAYNLSVCIAPSLLCPPNSGSLELKDNLIKKISLVQFLIENCLRIFGEDITSLLGENSMSRANSEKAAAVTGKQPLEYKPVRVIVIYKKAQLQNDTKTPCGMVPPSYLSTVF
uniref:rho GTPase-activating protein 20-like isoform X3 n=1 Tax=Halichoerus grypus TaxID=9711 RepID=UPI0016591EF2|nr:rho GTPase-activating protein 20-like isoform X3 [Halichoerus grypus]